MTKKLNDSQDDNENLISIDDLVEDSSSSDYGVELSAESWTVSAKTNKLGTIEQPSRVRSSLDDESDEMKQLLEAAEAGSSERARPQETSSTPNIKPATAKLEPSKEVQKILEELNRLEQLEEQKQQKTKQARVVVNSSAPTVKLKLPETKPPEGEQADTDFNKTLAELNFNEAQELLSRGDRGSAINRLKTAIGYDSKNIS
ncbi:MAG: hypothetical protein JNN15_16885, partial [Blastocatellia bacterium]|nr:hypothetical protein [Blastocatellia bacterium]